MSTARPQQLDAWTSGIREMLRLAQAALEYATAALLRQDPSLDESIAACSRALHALNHALEDHAATVVAARGRLGKGQLPTVIAAVHINSEAEALGALARQLADIAVDRRSRPAFPADVSAVLNRTSQACLAAVAQAVESIAFLSGSACSDGQVEIAELRRELYRHLLSGAGEVDVAGACEATLAARYYERGVAHAVSVIEHCALLPDHAAPRCARVT